MNKKIILIIIAVFILIIISLVFIRGITSKTQSTQIEPTAEPTQALPTISPDIKVSISAKNNNRELILKISGLSKEYKSIDYELTYVRGDGLTKGALGQISLNGEKDVTRDDIVLGTCSSGRCVYDEGVKSVSAVIKFNLKNGTSSIYQDTVDL